MKQQNPPSPRVRAVYGGMLALLLAATLLIPTAASAQEPGGTVPLPATSTAVSSVDTATWTSVTIPNAITAPLDEPLISDETELTTPAAALPAASLPLPAMPAVETLADITAASAAASATSATVAADALAAASPKSYIPTIFNDFMTIQADRMGYGSGSNPSRFPNVRSLYAGWYVNWSVRVKPDRPGGMDYVQVIRIHQDLVDGCTIGQTADRAICPYKTPASYSYAPSAAVIQAAARANPGSIWAIGNEIDRVDSNGGNQDEILPEIYAYAYHDLRAIVLAADPTARIAIGGVVQFTPLRKIYLDRIWTAYKAIYGVEIPVDVWNVHNFIGAEYCVKRKVNGRTERFCYAMGIPAGAHVNSNSQGEERGAYVGQDYLHTNMTTFAQQIKDFRAWMKAHGQINKELLVTEYGVLYPRLCADDPNTSVDERPGCIASYGNKYVNLEDPSVVQNFMVNTFNYFMTAKDCNLSSVDGCRLVQRWAWYSLDDGGWGFNPNTMLYNSSSVRTSTGAVYSQFAAANEAALKYP